MQGRIATLLQNATEQTVKTPTFHDAVNLVLSNMAHPEHVQWAPEFAAALIAIEQHKPYSQTMIQTVCLDQWTNHMHRSALFMLRGESEPSTVLRCPACTRHCLASFSVLEEAYSKYCLKIPLNLKQP